MLTDYFNEENALLWKSTFKSVFLALVTSFRSWGPGDPKLNAAQLDKQSVFERSKRDDHQDYGKDESSDVTLVQK